MEKSPLERGIRSVKKRTNKNYISKEERERKQFDRELRDCMKCRFFWGNNHRCELERCYKEKKQVVDDVRKPSKCDGCGYSNGDYCFPCMKDLLGKRGKNESSK